MTQQPITQDTVIKIAKLCKLDVTGQEQSLASMFNETLKVIEILQELDLSTLEETYQVTGLTNVFQQPGEPDGTISQRKALQNAKENVTNLFATQAVFDR